MKPKILKFITLSYEDKWLTIQTHYPDKPIKSIQLRYGNLYSVFVYIARVFRLRKAKK